MIIYKAAKKRVDVLIMSKEWDDPLQMSAIFANHIAYLIKIELDFYGKHKKLYI